jgi:hypothetical protein
MKKEDIVYLRFDVVSNGKKFKADSAAVVVEINEKFSSIYVVLFLEGCVIKVPESYIKSARTE